MEKTQAYRYAYALLGKPYATARMKGSEIAPNITGTVHFYPANNGTLVEAEIFNLPRAVPGTANTPPVDPFGFHLHAGSACGSSKGPEPFADALGHYNPGNRQHPMHAGDFPVLLGNGGYAYMAFYTDRFKPADAVGRTVIIHQNPDDFRTQPSGDSGKRIACGVVKKA